MSCDADCAGDQGGNPHDDFCCGADATCSDIRCRQGGFQCAYCCGLDDGQNPLGCTSPLCTATDACQDAAAPCACGNFFCDDPGGLDLLIECESPVPGTVTVTPRTCSGTPPPADGSLLRVAFLCFDSNLPAGQEKDAQYADAHDFALSGGTYNPTDTATFAVEGCASGNYLAAASWIWDPDRTDPLDDIRVQTQCSGGGAAVPECVGTSGPEQKQIDYSARLYSQISPQPGDFSCVATMGPTDHSIVEVRNGSTTLAVQGVMSGRYICSQSATGLVACDDPDTGGTVCPSGRCARSDGFSVLPESFELMQVNDTASGANTTFDKCCDWEPGAFEGSGAPNCSTEPGRCSPWDVQCTSAAIFQVCDDSLEDCEGDQAAYRLLDRVQWLGPSLDSDPGDFDGAPARAAQNCFRFSTSRSGFGVDDRVVAAFTLAPGVAKPAEAEGCAPPTGPQADDDFDGIYDVCDPVLSSRGPLDGVQSVRLLNKVRNEPFYSGPFLGSDDLEVGGEPAVVTSAFSTFMIATVPDLAVRGGTALAIDRVPLSGIPERAPQAYYTQWFGYVTGGISERAFGFDPTLDIPVDINAARTKSRAALNCSAGDGVSAVHNPWGVAFRSIGGVERELFTVGDVTTTAGTESRLLGASVQDHHLVSWMPSGGIAIPGSGRTLDVAPDLAGQTQAFVGRTWNSLDQGLGTVTLVDVDPAGGGLGTLTESGLTFEGHPVDIRVRQEPREGGAQTALVAYVTSSTCNPYPLGGGFGPMANGPICIECGGGTLYRHIFFHVIVLAQTPGPPPLQPVTTHVLHLGQAGCHPEPDDLMNLGMDFSADGEKLFIADPDAGVVHVIYTELAGSIPGFCVANEPCEVIEAGVVPVDVVVATSSLGAERLYVANRYGRNVSVFDASTHAWVADIDLTEVPYPDVDLMLPVALAASSDGKRAYVANNEHQTISIIDTSVDPPDLRFESPVLPVGLDATRLVVKAVPDLP